MNSSRLIHTLITFRSVLILVLSFAGTATLGAYAQPVRPVSATQRDLNSALAWVDRATDELRAVKDPQTRVRLLRELVPLHYELGNINEAGLAATEMSDLTGDSEGHVVLALAEIRSGDIEGALRTSRSIAEPKWAALIHNAIARVKAARGDLIGARAAAAQIADATEARASAHRSILVAEVLFDLRSIDDLLQATGHGTQDRVASLLSVVDGVAARGDFARAVGIAENLLQPFPSAQAKAYLSLARMFHDAGDRDRQIGMIRAAKRTCATITSTYERAYVLFVIGSEEVRAARRDEARETAIAGREESLKVLSSIERGIVEAMWISLLATLGDAQEAIDAATAARNAADLFDVEAVLSEGFASTNQLDALARYTSSLSTSEQRAAAYIGAARGLRELKK